MILSDLLSRQKHDDSNPHEIMPISFNMQSILQTRYYNLGEGSPVKSSEIFISDMTTSKT